MTKEITKNGTIFYYGDNGFIHREGGPAVEYTNGDKYWCKMENFIGKMDLLQNLQTAKNIGIKMDFIIKKMVQQQNIQMVINLGIKMVYVIEKMDLLQKEYMKMVFITKNIGIMMFVTQK